MTRLFSSHATAVVKRIAGTLGASALVVAMLASPAEADPPTVDSFEVTFEDVNPCTDEIHTVTIALTLFQHFHGERFVEHGVSTVTTTPTGFSGGGTTTFVETERLLVFRQTDVLTNEAGSRIMARGVFVADPATETVRVEMFELTCVRA
jgi:hypothetical protein